MLTGLQVALVRHLVGLDPDGHRTVALTRSWWRPALVLGALLGAVITVTGALSSPDGSWGRAPAAALVGLHTLLAVLGVIPQAVLLRTARLAHLGACVMAGTLAKSVVAATASGLSGSIAALLAGEVVLLVTMALASGVVGRRPRSSAADPDRSASPGPVRLPARSLAAGVAALAGVWSAGALDTVFARLLLGPGDADAYAGASMLARAGFFVPSAVALVAFVRFVCAPSRSLEQRRALRQGLVATGLLGGLAALVVAAAPHLVTTTIAGAGTVDVTALRFLVIAWAALAPATLLVLFLVAAGSRLALAPWAAVPVAAVGAWLAPHTPTGLAATVTATTAVVLALLAAPALLRSRPVTRAMPAGRPDPSIAGRSDVAVVVPYFNPGEVVATTLRRLDAVLAGTGRPYQIIAVADGCTDGSDRLVERMALPTVHALCLPTNRGKGAAIRAGFAASHAELVGFLDADGDLDPALLPRLLAAMDDVDVDVALGSKRHPESIVRTSTRRRIWSWGYRRLVRVLFRLDVGDTQTGIKLLRGNVVDDLLPYLVEDRFAFDLELFVVARARRHTSWVELPITLGRPERSTVSWRAVVRTLGDTLRIFGRLRVALGYEPAPGPADDRAPEPRPVPTTPIGASR